MEDGEVSDTRSRSYSNSGNNSSHKQQQQQHHHHHHGGGGRWAPRDHRRDRYDNRSRHDSRDSYYHRRDTFDRRDSFDRRGSGGGNFNSHQRYGRGPNEFRRSYSDQVSRNPQMHQPSPMQHQPPAHRLPQGGGRAAHPKSWGNPPMQSPPLRRVSSEPVRNNNSYTRNTNNLPPPQIPQPRKPIV